MGCDSRESEHVYKLYNVKINITHGICNKAYPNTSDVYHGDKFIFWIYAESKFYHFAERERGWSQNTSQNENKHSLSKYAFKIWRYLWCCEIYSTYMGMCDVVLMKCTPSHFITLLIVLLCILWEFGFLKSEHLLLVERAFEFNYMMFLFFVKVDGFLSTEFLFQASFWEWVENVLKKSIENSFDIDFFDTNRIDSRNDLNLYHIAI